HLALALPHAGHVQGPGAKAQSECRGVANEIHALGAVDHVLPGQAGDVGTGTADQFALDHGDALPPSRQLPGDILAGLPTPQDDILEALRAVHHALVPIDVRAAARDMNAW